MSEMSTVRFENSSLFNPSEFSLVITFSDFAKLHREIKTANKESASKLKSLLKKCKAENDPSYGECDIAIIVNGQNAVYAHKTNPCYDDLVTVITVSTSGIAPPSDEESCTIL